MNLRHKWLTGILATMLLVALSLPAFGQNLVLCRVESLDGAFTDIQTVALAAGMEIERDTLLAPALGMLGITDASFLDWKKPAVVVFPMAGMMLQQRGLVAILPVTDPNAAFTALEGVFAGHETEESLHVFSTEVGPVLYATVHQSHLVLGGSRDLVTQVDATATLAPGDVPPGNVSFDLFLEPVAPMIQMGLMGAKQQIAMKMQEETAGQEMPFDPATMGAIIDLYLGVVQNAINNISRVQVSLQLSGDHVLLHERIVPKAGTTLAGLVGAQKGGFPDIARLVDPDAAIVAVGNVEMTPAFSAAMKDFIKGYANALGPMVQGLINAATAEAEAGTEAETGAAATPDFLEVFLPRVLDNIQRTFECFRGDSAGSFNLVPGQGFSAVQAHGWKTDEACRALPQEDRELFNEIFTQYPQAAEFVSFSEAPVAGVPGFGLKINMMAIMEKMGASDPHALQVVKSVYGETMQVNWTYADDLALTVVGAGAENHLKGLLDARSKPGRKGLTPQEFLPLTPGPGFLMRLDAAPIMQWVRTMIPEGEAEAQEMFAKVSESLSGPAGRIPIGMRFDSSGATFQVAVSMSTIEAVSELVGMAHQEPPPAPAQEPTGS